MTSSAETLLADLRHSDQGVLVVYCPVTIESAEISKSLLPFLSGGEKECAARFRFDRDRIAYSQAHLLLRACLGRVTGRIDWAFKTGNFGKPDLDPVWGNPPLRINLSHTDAMVACALARGHDVGVDVEGEYKQADRLELARENFSHHEYSWLESLDEAKQGAAFTAIWTMKEAIVKTSGLGLGAGLDRFSVHVADSSVQFSPDLQEDVARWRLARQSYGAIHLAVAARCPASCSPPKRIMWREISPNDLVDLLI